MTERVDCSVCSGAYALRADGMVRHHAPPSGVVGLERCGGGGQPPRQARGFQPAEEPLELPPDPAPVVYVDQVVAVRVESSPPCGCALDTQGQPTDVWPGCTRHACEHAWSGWTRLPYSTADFRRCSWCQHVELQERQPCQLCGDQDARALEVPGYGLAYVCTPCVETA